MKTIDLSASKAHAAECVAKARQHLDADPKGEYADYWRSALTFWQAALDHWTRAEQEASQ